MSINLARIVGKRYGSRVITRAYRRSSVITCQIICDCGRKTTTQLYCLEQGSKCFKCTKWPNTMTENQALEILRKIS